MRKYLFAALLAGAAASPALAQSYGDPAPFTGLRAEGIVGYESVELPGDNNEGVMYGAGLGYDVQMGGAVVGLEGEYSASTVDECTPDFLRTGDELCAQVGRDLYVGGRAGAVMGSNTLLYAKAGYVNGRVETDYQDGLASEVGDYSLGDNLDGVRVGAGAEFALGPNSFAKTEYRYSNYEQDFEKHQIVAGFGFRF